MPKGTLEFNLPEESEEFDLASNADRISGAIDEYFNFLRAKVKYGEMPQKQRAIWDEAKTEFVSSFGEWIS